MSSRILIVISIGFCLLGCGSRTGTMQIRSLESNRRFAQTFSNAYAARSQDGAYDIVLVQDTAADTAKPGAPLKPVAGMPMRQIVHVHVLWKPITSGRADMPTTASNATIDWFVLSEDAQQRMNMLRYQGGGLVTVSKSSTAPRIDIRNASVKPVANAGDLEDPIGDANISGIIRTQRDPRRVQMILDELRTATNAAANPPSAAAQ